jgi:adenosylmethionine---8-amino-7-oxononanoate aminotransferase
MVEHKKDMVTSNTFLDLNAFAEKQGEIRGKRRPRQFPGKKHQRGIFITGTDTGVGKTVVCAVLGTLLQRRGFDVGIMKPVQCGGQDAIFLKKILGVADPLDIVNPYLAKEPLSPHLAFGRQKVLINPAEIRLRFAKLCSQHDLVLVEGAGGLCVPLNDDYLIADLIKDLGLGLIIVARLGLGTINHTLLTVQQARARGINVLGVVFNEGKPQVHGLAEKTNPKAIQDFGKVEILGTVPFLKNFNPKEIWAVCKDKIKLPTIIVSGGKSTAQQWADWDRKYLWHPFTQMRDWVAEEPLVIAKAKGNYLFDTHGHRYLDGVSSLWVNVHGHGQETIDAAIREQVKDLSHSTMLGLSHPPAIALAKRLVAMAPSGLTKVFYSDNGSSAVEIAIKMAYQYWQNKGEFKKTQIAHLANSYHGDTLGSVSVGGIDLFHKVYRNLTFPTLAVDFPDCYRAPPGKRYPAYAFEAVANMERLFKRQRHTIAALVVEPLVQAAAGMIVWPEGILRRMARICRQNDILFIADEVATGFGRTGKMFACEHEGISPDILCLAKGLTGGYLPLAATLSTQRVYDGFLFPYQDQKTFFHGHTYTGNPLCCAAALANLDVFAREKTLKHLQPKVRFLEKKLQSFLKLDFVGDVRQRGFMVGIELVSDRKKKKPYPWEERIGIQVCQEVRKRGVILRPLGNVVVLMPPLSISRKELEHLCDVTYWAIKFVTERIKDRRGSGDAAAIA